MLNKSNRISNRRLIEKLNKEGSKFSSHYLIIKFLPSLESVSKFAISISKKNVPKAVHRNKIRRQISESLRLNLSKIKKDVVAMVILKKGVDEPDYEAINNDVLEFINQI